MAALALDLTPCPAAAPGRATLVLLEPTPADDALVDLERPANDGQYPAYHYDPASREIRYEEYHPYGTSAYRAVDSSVEVSARRYRYTGMERDEETGLGYHSARYYAPWLGRWTAADPIGLGDGVNRYAYTGGNPTSRQDRRGHKWGLFEAVGEVAVQAANEVGKVADRAARKAGNLAACGETSVNHATATTTLKTSRPACRRLPRPWRWAAKTTSRPACS